MARRLGPVVYIEFRIPTTNSDNTSPADLERVDVYGYTGSPEGNEGIFKFGTLVASIPVRRPPEKPEETKKPGSPPQAAKKPEDRPPAPPRPPASMENGFDQGDTIVVTEPLGPAQFQEVVPKVKKPAPTIEPPPAIAPRPLAPAPIPPLPLRLYIAVGVNHKGQKGAVSGRQSVVLEAPVSAPSAPVVTYSETAFSISWTPPPDARQAAEAGDILKSTPIGTRPVQGAYNVYEVASPPAGPGGVLAKLPQPPAAGGRVPVPVNLKPVSAPPVVDSRMTFGKPRCYAVRSVTLFGTQSIEGDASPPACVTPVDTFAPAAPVSLKAVGSDASISLIWDANKEADLAGYVVLRATLPGGAFAPVTREPIRETSFNDTTVAPGVRYAYVVVAEDASKNRSAASNRVEE